MYRTDTVTSRLSQLLGESVGDAGQATLTDTARARMGCVPRVWHWSLHRLLASAALPHDQFCALLFPRHPLYLSAYGQRALAALLYAEASGQCYVAAPREAWYPHTHCHDSASEAGLAIDVLLADAHYLPFAVPVSSLSDPADWEASFVPLAVRDPAQADVYLPEVHVCGTGVMPAVSSKEYLQDAVLLPLRERQGPMMIGILDVSGLAVRTFSSGDLHAQPGDPIPLGAFARSFQALH